MRKSIAVLGSASDVGKSLVATALCRIIADAGIDVVPFKAQNMGNQAGVTCDGHEMPRAQMLQAAACHKAPQVDMGPVLMKPVTPTGAQIVVLGKAMGYREAREYFADTSQLSKIALGALDRLLLGHECVVIEGAGSPVELNLWERDYVNLRPARHADAAIVLVVDIDKGGVFAQAKGTLDLLPEADRNRVIGIVVNRFRGDMSLFDDAIPILERICATRVLGVIPYLDHGLDEEDRPIRIPVDAAPDPSKLRVGVVLYPRVSNTEDVFPLLCEPDVQVTFITDPRLATEQHVLILPGSKATVGDLIQLTSTGMAERILAAHRSGTWILGLCGGYQMLGEHLRDSSHTEGGPVEWAGFGFLPLHTVFESQKVTAQSEFTSAWPIAGQPLTGYEIHHGRTSFTRRPPPGEPLVIAAGSEVGWRWGTVAGCYLHGLLAHDLWRSTWLNEVRRAHGLPTFDARVVSPLEQRIARWTAHVRGHLRPEGLQALIT